MISAGCLSSSTSLRTKPEMICCHSEMPWTLSMIMVDHSTSQGFPSTVTVSSVSLSKGKLMVDALTLAEVSLFVREMK